MKRKVSLMEAFASCLIVSLVLSFCYGSLLRAIRLNALMSNLQQEQFEMLFLDTAIRDLIESIALPFTRVLSLCDMEKKEMQLWSTVYTSLQGDELFFVSRPVGKKPLYSNYVSCHLFVAHGNLCLATEPFWFLSNGQQETTTIKLMSKVRSISFEFYIPSMSSGGEVVTTIDYENLTMPRMLKLVVNLDSSERKEFVFFLYSTPFLFRVE